MLSSAIEPTAPAPPPRLEPPMLQDLDLATLRQLGRGGLRAGGLGAVLLYLRLRRAGLPHAEALARVS